MEFDFVRDYELFYQEPGATELLLMIDEGDLPAHVDVLGSQVPANKRAKGAYIQQVARRMRLKRRRVAVRTIVCASTLPVLMEDLFPTARRSLRVWR
jgi:hypothetical protein